jgi:hypothetical protein
VERRHLPDAKPAREREVEIVGVEVNHVEELRLAKHHFEHQDPMGQRVDAAGVESKRRRTQGYHRRAAVIESALANRVTSWPCLTNSSVR